MKLSNLITQIRLNLQTIGLIMVVSTALIGAVLFLHYWKGIPIGNLTRDPTSILFAPLYTGFLSQIGNLLWFASAAICLFTANFLSYQPDNLKIKRFFIVSGFLTLVLAFDDLFLLHEEFFPFFLGIPEEAVFASYALFVFFYLFKFYSTILKTDYILMGIALIFFGISITLDLLNPKGIDPFLFEDGAKTIGIVSWLAYFFRCATDALYQAIAQDVSSDNSSTMFYRRQ
jgi:preprotein translocase subunit SecG